MTALKLMTPQKLKIKKTADAEDTEDTEETEDTTDELVPLFL